VKKSNFVGSVLGLAIGDAVGYPCEFRSREKILQTFPPNGVEGPVALQDPIWPRPPYIVGTEHRAGTFTDDTQMSIAVARGLLDDRNNDTNSIMKAIAVHFIRWSRSADNDRSPGSTCMTGCKALGEGVPWLESGVADSKGCGSAMRVAPIGLMHWRHESRLLELARASSLLTHGHDAAIEGAAAGALLVARALQGQSPEELYQAVAACCGGRSADFDACWGKVPELLENEPAMVLAEGGLGEGWIAEEAVASAFYCYWRSPRDFRKIILTAANTDGDSDSIACIAGGIAGAALGVDAIPPEWLAVLEDADELRALAEALWDASGPSSDDLREESQANKQ
jgi:ADP-ribosylglycohydrolase